MDTGTISIIIAAIAACFSGVGLFMSIKKENKQDASSLTTVIVKLENIAGDIREVKTDVREVRATIEDHTERLAKVEQQVKMLNRVIYGEHTPKE